MIHNCISLFVICSNEILQGCNEVLLYLCVQFVWNIYLLMCSHIFLNAGIEMDSLLDPVIDSSHRSYFAAVEHRALEVLRPRPPGEAISIHHDWCDRYVMKYYCLSLMYSPVFLCFDIFCFFAGYVRPAYWLWAVLSRLGLFSSTDPSWRRSLTDGGRRHTRSTSRVGRWFLRCRTWIYQWNSSSTIR